jgi:dolichyl-phosphate-mannose-protein mannosyltransferase
MLVLLVGIATANARSFPIYGGYDEVEHQTYADLLIHHGSIPGPETRSEYYTPPGFYAVAGLGELLAEKFSAADPWKVARGLNILWILGSTVFTLLIARLLFPGRTALQLASLGFAAFVPVVLKTAAMFHPESLSLCISTAALYLAVRLFVRRSFSFWPAALLGVALGAAQLVRAFTLATFAAVAVAFAFAVAFEYAPRRRLVKTFAVVVACTVLVAGPWYMRQATRYSNPVFNQPTSQEPIWKRRPIAFYTALGLPKVFSDPIRPNYVNNLLPAVYSDLWGDYWGNFRWGAPTPPTPAVARQLTLQSEIGVVPTVLAILGWVLLLIGSLRRRAFDPGRLAVGLLPLFGLLSFLYFTVSYPTPDGDVLKTVYMLITVPGWALGFGLAVGALARNRLAMVALGLFLGGALVMDLGFVIFDGSLTGRF